MVIIHIIVIRFFLVRRAGIYTHHHVQHSLTMYAPFAVHRAQAEYSDEP